MKFYTSISEYYDRIFSLDEGQRSFIKNILKNINKPRILDIGCATGSLLISLCNDIIGGIGIDLDDKMIDLANQKVISLNIKDKVEFLMHDMKDIAYNLFNTKFDAILCLGNTLAHLLKENELKSYFSQVKNLLKENGIILIQIINYDKVVNENIKSLPVIENEYVKFERYYFYNEERLINFKTKLLDKKNNLIIENEVLLNPIRKKDLHKYLMEESFKGIEYFSSYESTDYNNDSIMLVVKAHI